MADLAGNMVSTPVMLCLAMAAISSASWKESQPQPPLARSTKEQCSAALDALRSIMPGVLPLDGEPEDAAQSSKRARN